MSDDNGNLGVIMGGKGGTTIESVNPSKVQERLAIVISERSKLLRENYPLLLETFSFVDSLASQVNDLRCSFTELTTVKLAELENVTSYDWVEEKLMRPHRERSESLRQAIRLDQERRQKVLLERSLQILQSNISLSTCLRIVNTLKQHRDFFLDSSRLMRVFLEARNHHIDALIEERIIGKRESLDDLKMFEALVKIMREPVLDVVTQYKAAFSDLYQLGRFLVARIEWFLISVQVLVKDARNTLVLASYWNQLVLLNMAYAGVGAAFLSLVEPAFVHQAISIIDNSAKISFQHVKAKMPDLLSLIRRSTTTQAGKTAVVSSIGRDLQPPLEIAQFPILTLIVNSFSDLFDQVRVFAIPPLREPFTEIIEKQRLAFKQQLEQMLTSQSDSEDIVALWDCFKDKLASHIYKVIDTYFVSDQVDSITPQPLIN